MSRIFGEYVNVVTQVTTDPMRDYDMTISYDGSGNVATVTIVGGGKTKTMTFGWTDSKLTSIATEIS